MRFRLRVSNVLISLFPLTSVRNAVGEWCWLSPKRWPLGIKVQHIVASSSALDLIVCCVTGISRQIDMNAAE